MIKIIFDMLPMVGNNKDSELINFVKGSCKYPENFKELINYIKWQLRK